MDVCAHGGLHPKNGKCCSSFSCVNTSLRRYATRSPNHSAAADHFCFGLACYISGAVSVSGRGRTYLLGQALREVWTTRVAHNCFGLDPCGVVNNDEDQMRCPNV